MNRSHVYLIQKRERNIKEKIPDKKKPSFLIYCVKEGAIIFFFFENFKSTVFVKMFDRKKGRTSRKILKRSNIRTVYIFYEYGISEDTLG